MNHSKATYIESGTRPKLSDELVPLMNKNIKCSIRLNNSKDAGAPNSDIYLLIKCRLENSLDYLTNKKVNLFTDKEKTFDIIDQSKIRLSWNLNNSELCSDTPDWFNKDVNSLLTKKSTSQAYRLPSSLFFMYEGEVLFHYDGFLTIGIHYHSKLRRYGVALNLDLTLYPTDTESD